MGLMIIVMMLNISLLAYSITGNISFDYNQINDDLSFCQLRRIMLIAYDQSLSHDSITFTYHNKEFRLSLVNSKLLLQPGTQIFLNDVESLYFIEINGCYVVRYTRKGKEYEKVICSKSGIYIDDFSDCDVLPELNSDGESGLYNQDT
ncbi:MAG: hypothetical protein Q4D13_01950 [Erysipelotrichaceae bacterium]|nr:hypothetical protein [Erysipelotrichaceae bacterium]